MSIMNTKPITYTTRRPFTFRERVLLAVLGGTLVAAASTMTGCAHTTSYDDALARKIDAARTASALFELALADAERRCAGVEITREHPCRALPEARRLLDKLQQAIVLADANRGALDDALTALEQIAGALDAARGP